MSSPRRPYVGGRRDYGRGPYVPRGWNVNLAVLGSFARTASAIAQTGAPTDGSSSFITTFATGVRVTENMGDGAGALLRIEGARTNYMASRIWQNLGAWVAGTATITADVGNGIDGTAVADRCNAASGQYGNYLTGGAVGAGGRHDCVSMWQRSVSGTTAGEVAIGPFGGIDPSKAKFDRATLTTTYKRLGISFAYAAGEVPFEIPSYAGIDTTFYTNGAAPLASDLYGDFSQWEVGLSSTETVTFPSSLIMSVSVAGTVRDADILTLSVAQLPGAFFTVATQFTQLSPEFANTDLASGDTYVLCAVDANNLIRITHDGTGVCVQALAGGAVKARSQYLTFSRNALLGSVKWDPGAGLVSVNNVPGPAGTSWTGWTPGTVRIGGIPSAGSEAFCRFGTLQSG